MQIFERAHKFLLKFLKSKYSIRIRSDFSADNVFFVSPSILHDFDAFVEIYSGRIYMPMRSYIIKNDFVLVPIVSHELLHHLSIQKIYTSISAKKSIKFTSPKKRIRVKESNVPAFCQVLLLARGF